jgi:hypothetical protein
MRERINIAKAIRLYQAFRNWREVATRMRRKNGMPYTTQAVIAAVRKHDRRLA